jgi:hypothetical protein
MSIGIFDGDELARRLLATSATCRACGSGITVEAGQGLAIDRGIQRSDIIICPKCSRAYTMRLVPGSLTLLDDVTDSFPPAGGPVGKEPGAKAPAAAPASEASRSRPWWKFWS